LIPIRTLGSEYFNYDEARHALIGTRSGAMHRLGDVVDVRLVEAAPVAGALRFELLSEGQVAPRGRRHSLHPTKAGPGRGRPSQKAGDPVATRTKARKDKARKPKPARVKPGKTKSGSKTSGKSKKGQSWTP
jgi:ribonuclease R